MKKYGCRQLIFSSSCTVYGNPKFLPITEEHPVGNVTNVYGRTKYFIEEMLKDVSVAEKVCLSSYYEYSLFTFVGKQFYLMNENYLIRAGTLYLCATLTRLELIHLD